jgi:Zn-dependent protease with chaperone function
MLEVCVFLNGAKTAVLLAALGGVMVGVGSLFGRGGAIIGLVLGLAVVGFSYWKSDTLAIRAARAVPADETQMPEYYAVMRELTSSADRDDEPHNPFANLFRTHPTTQERVARLRGRDV